MRKGNHSRVIPRGLQVSAPMWLNQLLRLLCWGSLLVTLCVSTSILSQAYGASNRKAKPIKKRAKSKQRSAALREGVIVKLEPKKQFLIDLGERDKVKAGMKVSVYRRVKVKHPISGKTINDRFFIGTIKLEQVSRFLSVAKTLGTFSYTPSVGDFVVPGAKPEQILPTKIVTVVKKVKVPVPCPKGSIDLDAQRLNLQWMQMKGYNIQERKQGWLQFLRQYPQVSYRQHIEAHINWLSQLDQETRKKAKKHALEVWHDPPNRVEVGENVTLVAAVVAPWKVQAVMLYYRPAEETRFRSLRMEPSQRHYYRVQLPSKLVSKTTSFQYFIEVIDTKGKRHAGYQSEDAPEPVQVYDPPGSNFSKRDRSQAYTFFEYVDFFTRAFGRDRYFKLEADYRYLLPIPVLYSVRMGFGIFEGQGNNVNLMDRDPTIGVIPKAYTYGYLEGEFRFHKYFALMLRALLGAVRQNTVEGLVQSPGAIFGLEGRARIGQEIGTNLVLGFTGTTGVGIEGVVVLTIREVKKFPMSASVIVTNLPLGQDLGVRLVYQIGWRPIKWFSIDLRVGWNIRNINHSGPTLGLGTAFQW